ncbi:MAG TPA: hypothetical protein VHD56_06035, partial [Tepidisphaeraceae bacterium]|nr:hypothetical protein [Tepidisphaeraceae bacterium]
NGASVGPLGTELRRAVALGPKSASTNGHAANGDDELLLWDSVGLASTQVAELSEKVGLKVKAGDSLKMLGVKAGPSQEFASAVALALTGSDRNLLPLNFVKSRLAPPPVRKVGRRGTYAIIIGAILLIAILAVFIDLNLHETTLGGIQDKLAGISKPYSEVQGVKDKVDFSDLYLKNRGTTLDVLREMTIAFGDDPQIVTTSFKIEDDKDVKDPKDLGRLRGTLTGKTTIPALANRLVSVLQQNPRFSNVNLQGIGSTGGNSRGRGEQSNTFSVEFIYTPNPSKTGATK